MTMTLEALVKAEVANAGGLKKVASKGNVDFMKVAADLEKMAASSGSVDTEMLKLASQTVGELARKLASAQENIDMLEKVSSVRSQVDAMLDAGVISRYDVQEKIAEIMNSDGGPAFSGTPFTKHANDEVAAEPQERGIFSSVLDQ